MSLNGLLGFKGPTHLMPTQTLPFDTPNSTFLCFAIPHCMPCFTGFFFIFFSNVSIPKILLYDVVNKLVEVKEYRNKEAYRKPFRQ